METGLEKQDIEKAKQEEALKQKRAETLAGIFPIASGLMGVVADQKDQDDRNRRILQQMGIAGTSWATGDKPDFSQIPEMGNPYSKMIGSTTAGLAQAQAILRARDQEKINKIISEARNPYDIYKASKLMDNLNNRAETAAAFNPVPETQKKDPQRGPASVTVNLGGKFGLGNYQEPYNR